MTNLKKQKTKANNVSLLFLVLPVLSLYFVIKNGFVVPFNEPRFLGISIILCLASFLLLWVLAYWRARHEKNIIGISLFFAFLWVIAGVPAVAILNQRLSSEEIEIAMVKIVAIRATSGGGTGSRYTAPRCHLTFANEVDGTLNKSIASQYCEILRPEVDGLLVKLKPGWLGMKWMADHSVIKDYEGYR